MYGPRPIRFSAHWYADYSKYRSFLAGGISTASSLLPFFGTRLRRQNFNLAPTQYCQLRRLGALWRGQASSSSPHPISLQFLCPRPPWLVCAPDQNRHASHAFHFAIPLNAQINLSLNQQNT